MKIRITTYHGTEELSGKDIAKLILEGIVFGAIILNACYFPNFFA